MRSSIFATLALASVIQSTTAFYKCATDLTAPYYRTNDGIEMLPGLFIEEVEQFTNKSIDAGKDIVDPSIKPADYEPVCQTEYATVMDVYDDNECSVSFQGSVKTGCCCNKDDAETVRTLTITKPSDNSQQNHCPTSRIDLTFKKETCGELKCCDQCRCHGDPHCKSFRNNKRTPGQTVAKTLLTCNSGVVEKDSEGNIIKCHSKIKNNSASRALCEAQAPQCTWLPTSSLGYKGFARDGAPCTPSLADKSNFTFLMHKDDDIEVAQEMGERGVINALKVKFKGDALTYTLDSKSDCFNFQTDAGVNGFTMGVESTDGVATKTVNSHLFTRRYKVAQSQQSLDDGAPAEVDVQWVVKAADRHFALNIVCTGGTQRFPSPGGGSASITSAPPGNNKLKYAGVEQDGKSTLSNVLTRLTVALHVDPNTFDPDTVEGFCSSGYADGSSLISEAECLREVKFRSIDYRHLRALDICKKQLVVNNCDKYSFTSKHRKNNDDQKARYMDILTSCFYKVCIDAFDPEKQGEFVPPPGTTIKDCVHDMLDFGIVSSHRWYTGTFEKVALAEECSDTMEVEFVNADDGVVTTVPICDPATYVEGDFCIPIISTKILPGGVNEHSISIDVSKRNLGGLFRQPPKEIRMVATNCNTACNSLPRLSFEAKFINECTEMREIITGQDLVPATRKQKFEDVNIPI